MFDNSEFNKRNELLYKKEGLEKLSEIKVAIIGLGGVGSLIPSLLVRSNISKLLLLDKDKVELSNLNRQLSYNLKDVGKDKPLALKSHLEEIKPDLEIVTLSQEINEEFDFSLLDSYTYIVDCIDDIKAKLLLIKYCLNNKKKIITSLGMGKRYYPEKVFITTLDKTYLDPLGKIIRNNLRKEGYNLKDVVSVMSKEEVKEELKREKTISSSPFVPNQAGLLIASYIVNDCLNIKE